MEWDDDARFEAIVFDWDGTAVPDRGADASQVRAAVEALCRAGVHVMVVSGTHVGNIDGQLAARPTGPGQLHLCLNRGSEVFAVGPEGPTLVWVREATAAEDAALERAAEELVAALAERSLGAEVVSRRLNRRKVDIIPEEAWRDPPKARIGELLEAVTARLGEAGIGGLAAVMELARSVAARAGVPDPRITSDVKHVEVGLTDKSDSARWAAAWLADRGVTGRLILVAGDELGTIGGVRGSDDWMVVPELRRAVVASVGVEPEGVGPRVHHLGGGPERFVALLDRQLALRRARRLPAIDDDPAWTIALPSDPALERAAEAIGALANGWAGTRGAREEDGAGSLGLFAVGGVYDTGRPPQLLPGPDWTSLPLEDARPDHRTLDLRTGVLGRGADRPGGPRTLRFVPLERPGALVLAAEGPPGTLGPQGDEAAHVERAGADPGADEGAGIVVAACDRWATWEGGAAVGRLAAWAADPRHPPAEAEAVAGLAELEAIGFDHLAAEHRAAWARRWAGAGVAIEGDEELDRAARFALFHLLAVAPDGGEAAVGARGLTGAAYGGHVFWDADVYVLPALAALLPGAAGAMLEYRIRRLPAARALARALGLRGARFPWESGLDGDDVTPHRVDGPHGAPVRVLTGRDEEHIVADVAWGAVQYAAWTGDRAFLAGPGSDLVVDTARYWASRVRVDRRGRGHLRGVMGPDEYHDDVDDNAFTNVMARWNLRQGATLLDELGDERGEAAAWRSLADGLVDGWDPGRGLHEQFAGYWDLEPRLVSEIGDPPLAVDVLLGADEVRRTQIIKQADVLMLHHLVPEELRLGSLADDLAFYGPRTAHGSSLSPAIHASLLARAGRPDDALPLFRIAALLDLDDLTGTTAGGLHLATMGGLWQALAHGFLGLRPGPDALAIDPSLPGAWASLGLRFRFRGTVVEVEARHDAVTVRCQDPLTVRVAGRGPAPCSPPGTTFELRSPP